MSRAIPPKRVVHVLDDLFSSAGFDVDVDVGWARARIRQEALKQKIVAHRVHCRDPQAVAHCGVGGTTPPLAQDAIAGAKVNDVFDDEEVARKAEALDDPQLVIDRLPRPGMLRTRSIALAGPLVGTVCKPRVRSVPVGDTGPG